jgi:putative hemolysin
MPNLLIETAIILLLILLNGIFAMSEIAIVSLRKARLQQLINDGNNNAEIVQKISDSPGDFLSTVQVGITLVGILAGAFGGATIAESLLPYINSIPYLAPYSEPIAIVTVVLVITYLTIVLGELVPKRIGLNNAERISMAMALPIRFLFIVAMPVVRLLSVSTEAVLKILRVKPSDEPPISEEEIKVMVDEGAKAGVFEEAESDMVESIFRLGDRRVSAMMVPRTDMAALFTDDSVEEIGRKIRESGHSSFPVCEGSLDKVLGVVYTKELLPMLIANKAFDLKASMKEPLFIPEGMLALKALELFKKSGKHMALIIDEYGGVQGLITIYDIMESVIGEVSEINSPKAIKRDDGSWLIDGMLPIDEYKNMLNIDSLPEEDSGAFQTVGGFIMTYLHRIPSVGNRFKLDNYLYEVVDMDGMRVDKVLVMPQLQDGSRAEN